MKSFWRSSFLTLIILAVDAIALARIWPGVYSLRAALNPYFSRPINLPGGYQEALSLLLVLWLCILARFKFYSHRERITSLNRLGPIFWAVFWSVVVVLTYHWAWKPDFGRAVVAGFAIAMFLYLFISRTIFRIIKRFAIERGHGRVRVLVIGEGEIGIETVAHAHAHPDIGYKIVGFVSKTDADGSEKESILGYPILGNIDDLIPLIQRHHAEEVFFALPSLAENDLFSLIERVQQEAGVVCKVVANMLHVIVGRVKVDEIIGLPVIAFPGSDPSPAHLLTKRIIDMVAGGMIGLGLLPMAFIFAVLIKLDSRGPVFFVHQRVGRLGRRFRMLKFRTMRAETDPYAVAPNNEDDGRITPFGRFLRKTSLDEIPQLINVLKGEMSLVGPRPEMAFIVEKYEPWEAARLEARPGLTGLWQVAGRKNLPLHFNLEYDYYYVKNQSLRLDGEILLRTIPAVLFGRGAY